MLARLAPHVVRRRRPILIITLVVLIGAAVYGGGVAENLTSGGFEDESSESARAAEFVEEEFGAGEPNLVLVATATNGSVDEPDSAADGQAVTARLLAEPGVAQAISYWSLGGAPPLRNDAGDKALVLVHVTGADEDAMLDRAAELAEDYEGTAGSLSITAGGQAVVFDEVGTTIEEDLVRAEMIALPVTLLLLVIVFGSLVAATLPVGVGILAVLGTFAVLQAMSSFTGVSIYSLNLATALGLGLAIDYSLFVVSRFREELSGGHDTATAVVRTIRTAGRTVLFSAVTVAISLAAMLLFPMVFFRSFAYSGIAVSLLAAVGAVVVLPALLAVLGPRVDSLRLFRRSRAATTEHGVWRRIATTVMRRPIGIATAVTAFLVLIGLPFFGINFSLPDDRVLPPGNEVRTVQDVIRDEFASDEAGALQVVADGIGDPGTRSAEINEYAAALSTIAGVGRVDAATGSYIGGTQVAPASPASERFVSADATWLSVVPTVEPMSSEGEQLVQSVRDTPAPFDVEVGGRSAELVDSKATLFSRMPLAAGAIALVTFAVLFLLFGSVLVPAKALVLNLLSLTATFGAMVWIFQDGHLSGLLDFTATGSINTAMPILMFCIAFGLSMDYEVFLLSRIKEEHDHGADNTTSVAMGLERTGRIVTAAAILIAVVFIAFATSGVSFIKLFGVGLTLAVLVDAFLIRATLVPAFMKLAGRANWWAPAPLRRIHERFGISETVDLDAELATLDLDAERARVGSG